MPTSATQISPRPQRDLVIAAGLGLVLALALAFFLEALDTRLRSADELVDRLGIPLLGRTLPVARRAGAAGFLPTVYDPAGIQAEAYRMVRLNVEFANLRPNFRLFMVTSALPGEGKTVTAANLAVSFARADRKVLLIDLDLRRPRMHDIFGVDPTPGVTDVALGRVALDDAVLHGILRGRNEIKPKAGEGERKPLGSLALLTAGVVVPDPGTFVETEALMQLLAEVQKTYEIVLIDTPPLLSVGDGLALGGVVDAALVVSRRRPAQEVGGAGVQPSPGGDPGLEARPHRHRGRGAGRVLHDASRARRTGGAARAASGRSVGGPRRPARRVVGLESP